VELWRVSLDALLDRTATIENPTGADDGQGGWTGGYEDPINVRCRRSPLPIVNDATVAKQVDPVIRHTVYVPVGTNAKRYARVTVDGLTLRVESMQTPSVPIYLALMCSELQKTGV
jgi:hypothetical protein